MNASPAAPSGQPGETGQTDHPVHAAIIMDGNGRWAKARGLPRAVGHERGVEALRRTVEAAQQTELKYLTVYSFSTENWRRPAAEVQALFALLKAYVRQDLKRLEREGVRIRIIGTRQGLPADIEELVDRAERQTAHNTAFNLCIAFNYGGREEILRGIKAVLSEIDQGAMAMDDLDETVFAQHLDTHDLPDPDLIIRTSGELRLSNFLVWQAAYSELVFMDVLWPDFTGQHLAQAIDEYRLRERRYGAVLPEAG